MPIDTHPTHFPETGHDVQGAFYDYWSQTGGTARHGYPISDVFQELRTDGNIHWVQYFERSLFEAHPENMPPFTVLLAVLGLPRYNNKYPHGAPNQQANNINPRRFPETGHTI